MANPPAILLEPRKRRRYLVRVVVSVAAFWPMSALADVGTPLVWATTLHLLVGNALLGWLEGWLLARSFGLPTRSCIWRLVAANYLSAWLGLMLLSYLFSRHATDIYSGLQVTWLLVAASYLMTLVIEWPFVALCFRNTANWFTASVKASLVVQSTSYALLFGGYWFLSATSLYSTMRVVPPDRIAPPPGVVMIFISTADGDVYCSELGGSAPAVKVADLNSTNQWHDHLRLEPSPVATNFWDLVADFDGGASVVLIPRIASLDQIPTAQGWRTSQYGGWGMASFQAGSATNSTLRMRWAHWPDVGMWARDGGSTVRIAFGTPFGGWSPYRVVHLPGDKALLQLERQICLVDIPGKTIGRLRVGYGILAFHTNQIAPLPEPGD